MVLDDRVWGEREPHAALESAAAPARVTLQHVLGYRSELVPGRPVQEDVRRRGVVDGTRRSAGEDLRELADVDPGVEPPVPDSRSPDDDPAGALPGGDHPLDPVRSGIGVGIGEKEELSARHGDAEVPGRVGQKASRETWHRTSGKSRATMAPVVPPGPESTRTTSKSVNVCRRSAERHPDTVASER
jgi:hypothetical protein